MTKPLDVPVAATPPRRVSLTVDGILDAAAEIVEHDGPHALTLRKLGTALGANHTAVLRHFAGKDEIVLALTARLLEDALGSFVPTGDWEQQLTELAHRVRLTYLANPGIATLVAGRVSRTRIELSGADAVIRALGEAGFEGREAALLYRTVTDLTFALGAYEASTMLLDAESREGDHAALQREYRYASEAQFPHLAAVAFAVADIDSAQVFDTAIELMMGGLRQRLAARA